MSGYISIHQKFSIHLLTSLDTLIPSMYVSLICFSVSLNVLVGLLYTAQKFFWYKSMCVANKFITLGNACTVCMQWL